MDALFSFLKLYGFALLRYFILAGIPFLIYYVCFPNRFAPHKIQLRSANAIRFRTEVLHSCITLVVFIGVATLLTRTPLSAYTKLYVNVGDYPIWWLPLSVLVGLVIHDTYFYFMHRFLHGRWLFPKVHVVHHHSTNPSPWAAYSFHVVESFTESLILPILLFTLPLHPVAIVGFTVVAFCINVYGHLGYEIMPRWFRSSVLFKVLNTSVYHNLHHSKFKGNYALYFRHWDRLLGTANPDYEMEYDALQQRRFARPAIAVSQLVAAA